MSNVDTSPNVVPTSLLSPHLHRATGAVLSGCLSGHHVLSIYWGCSRVAEPGDGVLWIHGLNPEGEIDKSAPGGGFILSGRLPRGVKSHRSPKNGRWRELFTLLDFRPENQNFVITISTISMRQNCSISCLAAPGGARAFSAHSDPSRYNYDVQSIQRAGLVFRFRRLQLS